MGIFLEMYDLWYTVRQVAYERGDHFGHPFDDLHRYKQRKGFSTGGGVC
jgi:hypothetical protein